MKLTARMNNALKLLVRIFSILCLICGAIACYWAMLGPFILEGRCYHIKRYKYITSPFDYDRMPHNKHGRPVFYPEAFYLRVRQKREGWTQFEYRLGNGAIHTDALDTYVLAQRAVCVPCSEAGFPDDTSSTSGMMEFRDNTFTWDFKESNGKRVWLNSVVDNRR